MPRVRPSYFDAARENAANVWRKLEADEQLVGPWRIMFDQVKSPEHVLSELLQNADDTGAVVARARFDENLFEFEHDGSDFDAAQCGSICRFAYSNKRTTKSIGFRGVGFRSTFSLGPRVEVLSPSLAMSFEERRFTLPEWIADAPECSTTTIRVPLSGPHIHPALESAFRPWQTSAASLLFFNKVQRLNLNGREVFRELLGDGPVPNSCRIRLHAAETTDVLLIRSVPEEFPPDAVAELRQERKLPDSENIPAVVVEIVIGLPGPQRLYTVLPTGVVVDLPFSINAPFVQDPARMAIKSPSTSPTNRWLLDRVGELAAKALIAWVGDSNQPLEQRAEAYALLPSKTLSGDGLAGQVHSRFLESFRRATSSANVVLRSDGAVCRAGAATAVPLELHRVWLAPDLREILRLPPERYLLASEVEARHLLTLDEWKWVHRLTGLDCLRQMKDATPPSPMAGGIRTLLAWVAQQRQSIDRAIELTDLPILPCEGEERLMRSSRCVRAGGSRHGVSTAAWKFLLDGELRLDEEALAPALPSAGAAVAPEWRDVADLLRELGFHEATPTNRLCERKAASLAAAGGASSPGWIQLARILAELDVAAPPNMHYVVRSGSLRSIDKHVLVADTDLESILPQSLIQHQMISEEYTRGLDRSSVAAWEAWTKSGRSGLRRFTRFRPSVDTQMKAAQWHKENCRSFVIQRQGADPTARFRYQQPIWKVIDWDFDPDARRHWEHIAHSTSDIWARVLRILLEAGPTEWQPHVRGAIYQLRGNSETLASDDFVPFWIQDLRSKRCVLDTYEVHRDPAELLMRTPATEPLQGTQPFVLSDLDTEANRPVLKLLGVRTDEAHPGPIIERIRSLAQSAKPPMGELVKWYGALDRLLTRLRGIDRDLVLRSFRDERLIRTSDEGWCQSTQVYLMKSALQVEGVRYVHPELSSLQLWAALGVRAEATVDALIEHVKGWQSDRVLDAAELTLVRSLLLRDPERVWDATGHWLGLDNKWRRATDFQSVLCDDVKITLARSLLPHIKQTTADARMLRLPSPRLAHLRDITHEIEIRRTRLSTAGIATRPEWLRVLGAYLSHFIGSDDLDLRHRVRAFGLRLRDTELVTVHVLATQAFLDGAPIGPEETLHATWDGTKLYAVSKKPAALCEHLIAAIEEHMHHEPVRRAVRSCYQREPQFIRDYLEEQFRFDQVAAVMASEASAAAHPQTAGQPAGVAPIVSKAQPPSSPPLGATQTRAGEPEVTTSARPRAQSLLTPPAIPVGSEAAARVPPPAAAGDYTEVQPEQGVQAEHTGAARPRTVGDLSPSGTKDGRESVAPPSNRGAPAVPASDDVVIPVLPSPAELSQFCDKPLPDPLIVPEGADANSPDSVSKPDVPKTIVREPKPVASSPEARTDAPALTQSSASLVTQFALAKGLKWSTHQAAYVDESGRKLREHGGLCPWQLQSPTESAKGIWVTECCLEANGLEMPADVYEFMRQDPMHAEILSRSLGHLPQVIPFAHLQELVKRDLVEQIPTAYVFRKS